MANNISIKDATGVTKTMKTTDNSGTHVAHHNIDNFPATQAVSHAAASQADGHSVSVGATTDAEAAGNGSVIAILKRLRTLLGALGLDATLQAIRDRLPAALVSGRLDVNVGNTAGLTNTQLRAAAVDANVTGLPAGLATSANQTAANNSLASIDAKLTNPLPVSAAALPLPTGAATAANQTTANTSLASLETKVGEVQANPTANTVLGRLKDLLTGIVLAAGDNNIGNVDVASLPALPTGTNTIGATRDAGAAWTQSRKLVSSANASGADVDASDAPTSGQKVVVDDIVVSVDTAMRVDFKEETSGTVIFSIYLPASGMAQITPRGKAKLDTADKKLLCRTSASGNVRATIFYHSEA